MHIKQPFFILLALPLLFPFCNAEKEHPLAKLPKAARIPSEITVVPHLIPNTPVSVAYATLQGQLARLASSRGIYMDNLSEKSAYSIWLQLMKQDYGSRYMESDDLCAILAKHANEVPNYIVYDHSNPDSLSVATLLASDKRAIVIDRTLVETANKAGLKQIADAADRSLTSLNNRESAGINPDFVIENPADLPSQLRDYAILGNILTFPAGNTPKNEKIMQKYPSDAIAFGWGDDSQNGECDFIGRDSKLGISMIPSNHVRNLSLLSGLKNKKPLKQKPTTAVPSGENTPHKKEHIVTIAFTDGDNISWLLYDFPSDKRWFGSPNRGAFPAGWGNAPILAELSPGILEWFYEQAAPNPLNPKLSNDHFLVGPSGNGYFYPSYMPLDKLEAHCRELNTLMEKADLHIVQILDFDSLDKTEVWDAYTKQPAVDGILYCDYAPYDKSKGKVVWSNNKAIVSSRAMLWKGVKGSDIDSVAKLINEASTDTTTADAYSYIIVHVWTYTYDEVIELTKKFAPHVRLVAPDEFFRLIQRIAPQK